MPKRWVHGMKMRSMANAATVAIVRQTVVPLSKQQDLQQKVSYGMDRAQNLSKLPTSLCEVEDYYSSDSSSPSLKRGL